MKKILFVYPKIMIGGSTTSLLSLLRSFNYDQYKVDLLLYKNGGELIDLIPSSVNILMEAAIKISFVSKILSSYYLISRLKTLFYKNKSIYNIAHHQIMSYANAKKISRKLNEEYDVAIGFLEFWPNAYVIDVVKAKKKIGWIHTDYIDAGFIPKLDRKAFSKLDNIVTVSEKCKQSLLKCFPESASKVRCILNILSSEYVQKLADENVQFKLDCEFLRIVTVCRLTNNSKGLDRGVSALSRLKKEGYHFNWYIVGDGPDKNKLEQQIDSSNCTDCIHLLGKINNPYPYIKQADIFFLPSRYEGKPMVITEAQMLNVPAIVTEYSSAREQIEDGIEGIITANNDEAIYDGLKFILNNPHTLSQYKTSLSKINKSNLCEVEKIYNLIDF